MLQLGQGERFMLQLECVHVRAPLLSSPPAPPSCKGAGIVGCYLQHVAIRWHIPVLHCRLIVCAPEKPTWSITVGML